MQRIVAMSQLMTLLVSCLAIPFPYWKIDYVLQSPALACIYTVHVELTLEHVKGIHLRLVPTGISNDKLIPFDIELHMGRVFAIGAIVGNRQERAPESVEVGNRRR